MIRILILIHAIFLLSANILFSQVNLEWTARYYGLNVLAMALDSTGNIIVTGGDNESPSGFVTVKFNSSGQFVWATRFSGGQTVVAQPRSIGVDIQGNIYVGAYDVTYILLMYNSNGVQQWSKRYKGNGSGLSELVDLVIDNAGNIVVTGSIDNITSSRDIGTVKYNTSGDSIWVRNYTVNNNTLDWAEAMDISNKGLINVTGYSTLLIGANEFLTLSYNSNGSLRWARTWNGLSTRWDIPYDVASDKNGNVYVTGYSIRDTAYLDDIATLKYDSLGNLKWVRYYDTTIVNRQQCSYFIKIDPFGDVIVAGYSVINNYDYCTLKYDSSGNFKWVNTYNGLADREDFLNDLAVDKLGGVYVTGVTKDVINRNRMTTIKYDKNGNQQWLKKYPDYDTLSSGAKIIVDKNLDVYIAGTMQAPGGQNGIVLKYSQLTSISQISNEIPDKYKLYQNYPNPFNPFTKIKYEIQKNSIVQLKVFDMLGKEVQTLVNEAQNAGTYETSFNGQGLSSGTYIYELKVLNQDGLSTDFKEVKRMVLLK